jgi:uncharacterized membrane protein
VIARETEVRSLLLQQRLRNARRRLPPALRDYARLLTTAVLGYGLLTALLEWLTPIDTLYALPALALLFSVQATSYGVKATRDPDFVVPGCGCGGVTTDDTAAILRSSESKIAGMPISVLGVLLYTALLAAVAADTHAVVSTLAVVAALASAYLGYVMVARIASVCGLCVNVAALNVLLLVHLVA